MKTLFDYGWLDPEGKFYPVQEGHEDWALEYLEKHFPDDETEYGADLLIEMGWILMNSPYKKEINIKTLHFWYATKKQKEFLYDYFTERGCQAMAVKIFKDTK